MEIPSYARPYAVYKNGFKDAKYYLEEIKKLKINKQPFQFIVCRKLQNGVSMFNTNMKVTLEDYEIKEDADEGFDVIVSIKLKQFREYSTKTMKIEIKQDRPVAKETKTRQANTSPAPKTENKQYTVVKGDCLWNIAKKYYGNGREYAKIFNANRDKIKNANLIYPRSSINNSSIEEEQNVKL